jgi:hypothetical protein
MAYETTTKAGGVGTTTQVVVGLFTNANDAHKAVTQLRADGFGSEQIGAAFRGRSLDAHPNSNDAGTVSAGTVDRERENWWEKLKDSFRFDDTVEHRSGVATDPYSHDEHEYEFAEDDFEGSLAGTGIPSDRAAHLTRGLEPGGALVTVRDATRALKAEQILSANHARIRYERTAAEGVVGNDVRGTDVAGTDPPTSTGRETTDTARRPLDASAPVDSSTHAIDRVQLFRRSSAGA